MTLRKKSIVSDVKPRLEIESVAKAARWLEENLGSGPLSGLFEHNGKIVHTPCVGQDGYVAPKKDRDNNGPAEVTPMSYMELQSRLQYEYDCYKVVRDKQGVPLDEVPAVFPLDAARMAHSYPQKMQKLRHLRAVIHVPVPRANGTLITKPGYDELSQLLYLPDVELNVPRVSNSPTELDMKRAFNLLTDMIGDFPFVTGHDEANYVGFLLTPLLREMVPGPYKLTAIGAPSPGSGKSFLAAAARTVHGGVFRSEMPDSDVELAKTIAGVLTCTTAPVVQFDNVTGILKSSKLAGLLTSREYSDRLLGSTNERKMVNDRVWCVTGNNLLLGGDMVRRTVQITIDPKMPNPETRTEFAIADFDGWVHVKRGQLVWALLTLVSNWVAKGKPLVSSGTSDSYKGITEALRGILTAAGITGVYDHLDSRRVTVGADDQEWCTFLEAAHRVFGTETWTVKHLLSQMANPVSTFGGDEFAERAEKLNENKIPLDALPAKLHEQVIKLRDKSTIGRSLGMWLVNRDGRYAGDRITARQAGKDRKGYAQWKIDVVASKVESQSAAGA